MTQRKVLFLTTPQSFDELDLADLPAGIGAGVLTTEQFAGDGIEDTFTLANTPSSSYAIVTVNGAQVTTYGISGDDVVFTTAPDSGAEILVSYVYGGGLITPPTAADVALLPAVAGETNVQDALGVVGELADRAMRPVGPFTVNYNSANILTTGAALWTPLAGYLVYNMWFEMPVEFIGSGGFNYADISVKTSNDVLLYAPGLLYVGSGALASGGTDVASTWLRDALQIQAIANTFPTWFPARIKVTTPILLKLEPDAGTMTAGQIQVYAMVGELA